jgi:23S rRNA pseudouridine1911/1915/1917 synthase
MSSLENEGTQPETQPETQETLHGSTHESTHELSEDVELETELEGTLELETELITEFSAEAGRLDQVLAAQSGVTRSQIQNWIEANRVQVDGKVSRKAGQKLHGGEKVSYQVPELPSLEVLAEEIPLEVLYEDDQLIAVNKPPGMITHPAPGVYTGTLINALLGRLSAESVAMPWNKEGYRPGVVHRLDKETSGVIVVAKTVAAQAFVSNAFKERQTKKVYLAIVHGHLDRVREIDLPIGRHPIQKYRMAVNGNSPREAMTQIYPLAHFRDATGKHFSLIECHPFTGRTHQIRVHLAHLKMPILGDITYGRESGAISRQALHAWKLEVPHPSTSETLKLEAPLPEDILLAWLTLGGVLPEKLLEG